VDVVKSLRFATRDGGIFLRGEVSLETVEKLPHNFPAARSTKDKK
jgi:hypothetical protein